MSYRVGIGVDAHALEEGVPLVLGGVAIDHPRGLAGHSDGDVLTHALIDALLGAAGLGDIGSLFPSGDPALKGADSLDLLARAYGVVREAGWELVNADCVLVVGSSLVVHPVAALPRVALEMGASLVIVNESPTDYDDRADAVVRQKAGAVDW